MKIKKKIVRDIFIRKESNKKESMLRSLKVLTRLKFLNYLEVLNNISKIKKSTNFNRVKNRCFVTSRSNGVYKRMTLSRIKIKELTNNGLILGLKKLSW
jgi:small subunit ribosomal protein S14